jgi:hypothetical protein
MPLKEILKQELSNPIYKNMSLAQKVTYLNARKSVTRKLAMQDGKDFSVEPNTLLKKAGIDPQTINQIFGNTKTKGYLKAFLSKPVKCNEFDYWIGVFDWMTTVKVAWFRRNKLLSMEQVEALKKHLDEVVVNHGGTEVVTNRGSIRIEELTGGEFKAIRVQDLEEVCNES